MVQDFRTIGLPALLSFYTVARLGGVSAAATHLRIAKSGVSRHVSQLETHFGVKLLERGGRTVRLTPVGIRLEHRIRSILAEIDLLDDIAREESSGVTGQVTIAATPEFGGLVAKEVFPRIRKQHPDLKIILRPGYDFEDMQDPSTDIALRIGTFKDDRLIARKMGVFRLRTVAAPMLARSFEVNHPEDLKSTPCLTFRGYRSEANWTYETSTERIEVEVTGQIAVRSFAILLDLAIAGQGFARLPEFMLDKPLQDGALVRCLPEFPSQPVSVYLTFRPGARRIARIDCVISLLEELVPNLLAPDN